MSVFALTNTLTFNKRSRGQHLLQSLGSEPEHLSETVTKSNSETGGADASGQKNDDAPRPIRPDGTTDWAVVFDDPEKGIITAVRLTTSPKQLSAVLSSATKLLYRRKRDAEAKTRFENTIAGFIKRHGAGDFDSIRIEVIRFLDREKRLRIRKAAQYARNKRLSQGIERRKESTDTKSQTWWKKPVLIGIGVISVVIAAYFLMTFLSAEQEPRTDAVGAHETNESSEREATPAPKTTRPSPPPAQVPVVLLKPIPVSMLQRGQTRRVLIVPVIELHDEDEWEPLCALGPYVIEAIILQTHAAKNDGQELSASLLGSLGLRIWKDFAGHPSVPLAAHPLSLRDANDLPRRAVATAEKGCVRLKLDKASARAQ